MVRQGYETLEFGAALANEPARIDDARTALLRDPNSPATDYWRYSYVARGQYAEQLAPWIEQLGRDRVMVVRSEDYRSNPAPVYGSVTTFLGISAVVPAKFTVTHSTSPLVVDPQIDIQLRQHFEPHNAALRTLLNTDIRWDRPR